MEDKELDALEGKLLAKLAEIPASNWVYRSQPNGTYKTMIDPFTVTLSLSSEQYHEKGEGRNPPSPGEIYSVNLLVQNTDPEKTAAFESINPAYSDPRRKYTTPPVGDTPVVKFYRELTEKISAYEAQVEVVIKNRKSLEARQKLESLLDKP